MKKTMLLLPGLLMTIILSAQLKASAACPSFSIDILDGKVNELVPTSTNGEIKGKFPCFTSEEAETTGSKCGGSVVFKDKDIYFYTGRDYVEIREKFKGKLSIPLMGTARGSHFKVLGLPKIKDAGWDAFQTAYGTLVLYYNRSSRVNKIQFSTKSTDALQLCE